MLCSSSANCWEEFFKNSVGSWQSDSSWCSHLLPTFCHLSYRWDSAAGLALITGTQGRQCVLRIEGKQERPCTNDVDISICSRHQAKISWLMILAVCRISFQDWRRTHVAWVAWRMLLKCWCLALPGEFCKGKKSTSAMSKSERRSKSFLAAQVLDVLD